MRAILAFLALMVPTLAADTSVTSPDPLQNALNSAVQRTLTAFADAKLKPDELAVTACDMNHLDEIHRASYRGGVRIYPASVVKLFYLQAAHRWMQDGKLEDSPELRRAMHDMIVDSSNDATHYVIDVITGTTSGPELPAAEMAQWSDKRNLINRYFASIGYTDINANQKPWCEGPYGRERVFVGEKYDNRNALTTDATARLLAEMVSGRCITPQRSAEMMELLKRDPLSATSDPDDQAHGFTALALPPGTKLWSKAGWTSQTRHDAAYFELPAGVAHGQKLLLVVFTVNHANERDIIPTVARELISNLK